MEIEPIPPATQLIAKNRVVRNSTQSKHPTSPAVCDAVQRDRAKPEQRRLSSGRIRWHHSTPADATRFVHRTQREIGVRKKSNGKERERRSTNGETIGQKTLLSSSLPLFVHYWFVHYSSIHHRCPIVRLRPRREALAWSIE